MPNPILSALGAPGAALIDAISGVIGRFVASPDDKLKAQVELTKAAQDYQVQLANIDLSEVQAGASTVQAETKSDSWAARNWRPIAMLVFIYIILHSFVLVPLFGLRQVTFPPQLWALLTYGMGGYAGARTVEKIADIVSRVKGA